VIRATYAFFVHSGEATQEVVERYDSGTLALEAVSVINQAASNIRVFNEYGEQVSPADLQQLAAEENESDDA
jgi:hypothetical protein